MRKIFVNRIMPAAFVLALVVGACGKGNQTASPTGPTSAVPPSAGTPAQTPSVGSGATITGTVVTGAQPAALAQQVAMRTLGSALNITVSVSGTSVSGVVDGAGNFELDNVPPGDQTLVFSGRGIAAQLTITGVGRQEQIHVTVRVNGTTADLDDDDRETPDNRVEVEGPIDSVTGSCGSGVIVVVGRRAVAVSIPPTTPIRHGGTTLTCAALSVGTRVHIHATRNGTTLTATDVEVQTDNPGSQHGDDHGGNGDGHNDDNKSNEADLTGTVAGLPHDACPTLTFTVSATTVTTNASTKFEETTCATLANGDRVEVTGTKQSTGSVLATVIEKKK